MDGFVKCFAKFAVVLSIGLAVILLIVAGLLIFKPMFLLKVLYYGIILVCLIGAVWKPYFIYRRLFVRISCQD